MSWSAAQWALSAAPMPKSDPSARLVLAHLAEKADKNGRDAYPLVITIAHDLDLHPDVVTRVLRRLVSYGLIARDGMGRQGQTRWRLNMDQRRAEGSFEEFCGRHREAKTARQARWRQKSGVDDGGSSQPADVDDDASSRRRRSVVSETTMDRLVDDSSSPHNRPSNHPEPPGNRPSAASPPAAGAAEFELTLVDPPAKRQPSTGELFARFWLAYPRRVGKKAAEVKFTKAIKDGADPEQLIAGAERYAHARKGQDPKFTAHPSTWLTQGRWDDEPEQPLPRAVGDYTPYRDPADQSVYDQPLL